VKEMKNSIAHHKFETRESQVERKKDGKNCGPDDRVKHLPKSFEILWKFVEEHELLTDKGKEYGR
jgi:hypothetical protein